MIRITSNPSILNNKEINFVDMHFHSTFSDGNKTPEYLAKLFTKMKKGICLTDHNQIKGSAFISKQKNLFSIPAIEITSKEAKDVLGYFYSINDLVSFWEKEIKGKIRNNAFFNLNRTSIKVFDVVEKITEYNGIPILAHPFALNPKYSYNLMKNSYFLKKIKGLELFTADKITKEQSEKIIQFKKPMIAGSDGHGSFSFNFTGASAFDTESFLKSILKRNNIIYHNSNYFDRFCNKSIIFKNNVCLKAPSNI
jgi:predicted metal-dependent phosphoesterase TrpH